MAIAEQLPDLKSFWFASDKIEQQLKDYVAISQKLIWQRQAIFLAATMLAVFYFDPLIAIMCYAVVLFTELLDLILSRRIGNWTDHDPAKARGFLIWIVVNTVLSASAICLFVIAIALQEGVGGHFTPLFFLFAAAIFAAMNNHQLVPVLILRLILYGVTFLLIGYLDIWRINPPLQSKLWLNFFTVLFVMYFAIDCSRVFLKFYRNGVRQLEKIKQEHARTKAAYEVKAKFLATVSHELRTPLTSIKGSLDLVNTGALGQAPESMKAMLRIAGKNSERLADLIDDLLDLQKIEAGEMVFRFDTVSVSKLILDSAEASKGYAAPQGKTIETVLPDEDIYIRGDEFRLMQVMANLLSNALKFSDQSDNVVVSASLSNGKVRISVSDKGVGIPEDARDQVFGQFSQVDSSDQRKVGGTGLGMSITKRIVERHNGQIDYFSKLGEGATFFVEFDACPTPEQTPRQPPQQATQQAGNY